MKKLICLLLLAALLAGCSLVTPTARECRESAIDLVESPGDWDATLFVKTDSFQATGTAAVYVSESGATKTVGCLTVASGGIEMTQDYTIVGDPAANVLFYKQQREGAPYVVIPSSQHFQKTVADLISEYTETGRFTNRTFESTRGFDCYAASYEARDASVLNVLFPAETTRLVGENATALDGPCRVILYIDSDKVLRELTLKYEGGGKTVEAHLFYDGPGSAEVTIPDKTVTLEEGEVNPLQTNWNLMTNLSPQPPAITKPKKEEIESCLTVPLKEGQFLFDGVAVNIPCKVETLTEAGFTPNRTDMLAAGEIAMFQCTNAAGDRFSATAKNTSKEACDVGDAVVFGLAVSAESVKHTRVILPGCVLFGDTKDTAEFRLSGLQSETVSSLDPSETVQYVMGNIVIAIEYYGGYVDEYEFGVVLSG